MPYKDPGNPRVFTFCSHFSAQSGRIHQPEGPIFMSDRFPPLRPQSALTGKSPPTARAMPGPVDLTLLAALILVVALALF